MHCQILVPSHPILLIMDFKSVPKTPEVLLLLVLCANSAWCLEGTKKCEYFSTFWTDGYKLHLSTAYAEKWEEHQIMKNIEGKELFLQVH